MGSRLREKPQRMFEVFVEIAKPEGADDAPFIIQKYPQDYEDKEALMMIPKFAYPCKTEVSTVDHFSFVLTDLDSMFRFGYCRHSTGLQTCLCIVSWLPWYEVFYKLLDLLAEITNRSESNNVTEFLSKTYKLDIPTPRLPVTIVANEDMFSFTAPDSNALPSIQSNRNLKEYYSAVDLDNMMRIFASMLHERRIYMTSKKLSRLTACIHAAEGLLYPMHWQHLYIPILPAHLIDYISAPMPYLIGVHKNLIEKLEKNRVDVGDAVVVDLDNNTVVSDYDDLKDLPEDVSKFLKKKLKKDSKTLMLNSGDGISKAFLQAIVRLIGGYRKALKFRSGEAVTFDPEAFVLTRPSSSTQLFLEAMLSLQIFQQFIRGRLEHLESVQGYTDIFEVEAQAYEDKLNTQSKYKDIFNSAKKSGTKGIMKLRRKSIKITQQGKKAMSGIKTKFTELTDVEEKDVFRPSGGLVHAKPKSLRQISAVEPRSARPPRPPPPNKSFSRPESRSLQPDEIHDDSQLRLSYHTVDVSLMGDQDIQAAIFRSASAEMLPKHYTEEGEVSSGSSSAPSSDSVDECDSNIIPFDKLGSSEEVLEIYLLLDLNFEVLPRDMKEMKDRTSLHQSPHRHSVMAGEKVYQPQTDQLIRVQSDKLIRPQSDKLIRPATKIAPASDITPIAPPRGKKNKSNSSQGAPPASPGSAQVSPRPLPRLSTSGAPPQDAPTQSVQDAPLIKFDSTESETTDSDIFDPLASSKSAGKTSGGVLEDSDSDTVDTVEVRLWDRNKGSRVSLTRSEAFRRETQLLRPSVKGDDQDLMRLGKDSTTEFFDPLATSNKSNSSDGCSDGAKIDPVASSHTPRRESSDLLMHEWSVASLTKGPNISIPVGIMPLRQTHANNPFLSSHLPSPHQSPVHQSLPTAPPHLSSPILRPGVYTTTQHSFQRSSLPFTSSPNPHMASPGKLPAKSYAPYSRPQSAMPGQNNSMANTSFGPSTGSNSMANTSFGPSPLTPGSTSHPSSARSSPTPVSLRSSPAMTSSKASDTFSDLIDIDFGGTKLNNAPGHPDKPQQSKWETFE
ncbi:DENN domain-containing protein 1C-like isoform X2 [Physella acuta]|uniref:DENN domain-containing protein 1C-like isoform X2 n=1 Tax=Physella acuta TaxID=109671 RepID=UPI0027DBDF95|nr:DENN domain-containing protein 1C-like isoform X2 [Physella acuta]